MHGLTLSLFLFAPGHFLLTGGTAAAPSSIGVLEHYRSVMTFDNAAVTVGTIFDASISLLNIQAGSKVTASIVNAISSPGPARGLDATEGLSLCS